MGQCQRASRNSQQQALFVGGFGIGAFWVTRLGARLDLTAMLSAIGLAVTIPMTVARTIAMIFMLKVWMIGGSSLSSEDSESAQVRLYMADGKDRSAEVVNGGVVGAASQALRPSGQCH
ncbi:hypothetical protein DE146DRAFT_440366 [Phaeosphaeria sp. MPI-PUGE-AT-0046c]|nr:hypothetical protein DE146DRAFT_440366 [Phaeosphaeria sp. MPI-PUGE-AT-0046c]